MAGTKLADLSLQITPCKEDEKKEMGKLNSKERKKSSFYEGKSLVGLTLGGNFLLFIGEF